MSSSEWVGSLGVGLLLVAFFLNLLGRIPRDGVLYAGMNSVGAGLACWASLMIGFIPFVVLEGSWCLFALLALGRRLDRRKGGKVEAKRC